MSQLLDLSLWEGLSLSSPIYPPPIPAQASWESLRVTVSAVGLDESLRNRSRREAWGKETWGTEAWGTEGWGTEGCLWESTNESHRPLNADPASQLSAHQENGDYNSYCNWSLLGGLNGRMWVKCPAWSCTRNMAPLLVITVPWRPAAANPG